MMDKFRSRFSWNALVCQKSRRMRNKPETNLHLEAMESRLVPARALTGPLPTLAPVQPAVLPTIGDVVEGNFEKLLQGKSIAYDTDPQNNKNPVPHSPEAFNYYLPGTAGTSSGTNIPFNVNFLDPNNPPKPVQTSDWWSNLMLRTDPTVTQNGQLAVITNPYANTPFVSDPAMLQFVSARWGQVDPVNGNEKNPFQQGLSIFSPNSFAIQPDPTSENPAESKTRAGQLDTGNGTTTARSYNPAFFPTVTVGIGGDRQAQTDLPADEISPLGFPGAHPKTVLVNGVAQSNGRDESRLNVRIRDYSDWGLQAVYGNNLTNPDLSTDKLDMTMVSGSPFTWFQKTGDKAYAKLWLQAPAAPAGIVDPNPTHISYWKPDNGDGRLGVTLTTFFAGDSGEPQVNISSYLIIAIPDNGSTVQWKQDADNNGHGNDPNGVLFKADMGSGKIVVVVMPHVVTTQTGGTPVQKLFEQLGDADKARVAAVFSNQVASAIPNNTLVSNDQTKGFGLNTETSTIRTQFQIITPNNAGTLQALYPTQYKNLDPATPTGSFQFDPGSTGAFSLSYTTLKGEAKLYQSTNNTFVTQLRSYGILNSMPGVAVQTDATVARALFEDLQGWMTRILPDSPGLLNQPLGNTYYIQLMQLSEELQIADQLASPTSLLTTAQQATAAQWRDWLVNYLKEIVLSWFDPATGRLFFYSDIYDTMIGYPAGYGSDTHLNDHHFHYGYFLNAFSVLGQFDPTFMRALAPQISDLVGDIGSSDRSATAKFPFLREFNPWAGHSWADGLGRGGNNEESASEAVSAWAGITKLGQLLGKPEWVNWGSYMYESEIEAMNQYWFNIDADPTFGQFGNFPSEYSQYQLQSQQINITQNSKVAQNEMGRVLFFATNNPAEGINAINWLPVAPHMLFLGRNQEYLERNWDQFVSDYKLVGTNGVYQGVVSAYQALMPDDGLGMDNPGPSNSLIRLDPTKNPAVLNAGLPFYDAYSGISRTIALDWIYTLQKLGQVDTTVVANSSSYGVFVKDGQRSFVAQNPTDKPVTVIFREKNSGMQVASLYVRPGETVTQLPSGALITDQVNQGKATGLGNSLYLTKATDTTNPDAIKGQLTATPGTQVPKYPTGPLPDSASLYQTYLAAVSNTYVSVPKRTDGNANQPPKDPAAISTFSISNVNGNYIAGQQTGLSLFMDAALTWKDKGAMAGPGVMQNETFSGAFAVIQVAYQFSPNSPTRTEVYTFQLKEFNYFFEANTITPTQALLPGVPDARPKLDTTQSNLIPFQNMQNGTITVSAWAGSYNAANNSNKEFALSVNGDPLLARSSRVVIPFDTVKSSKPGNNPLAEGTDKLSPIEAEIAGSVPGSNPRNTPVDAVRVRFTVPPQAGSFTGTAVSLNGKALGSAAKIALQSDGSYLVSGLSSSNLQANDGRYLLSVSGTTIKNGKGIAGSGVATVSWEIDRSSPTVQLLTNANPATGSPVTVTALFSKPVSLFAASKIQVIGATLANFRGSGALYAFDLFPTTSPSSIQVSVAAGAGKDIAGNSSLAATPLTVQFNGVFSPVVNPAGVQTDLTAIILSPAKPVTLDAVIPVTVLFSKPVVNFSATSGVLKLVNAQIIPGSFGGSGAFYQFLIKPTDPGTVGLSIIKGTVKDASGKALKDTAEFTRIYQAQPGTRLFTLGTTLFSDPNLLDPTKTDSYIKVYASFATAPNSLVYPTDSDLQKSLDLTFIDNIQNAHIVGIKPISGTLYEIDLKPVLPTGQTAAFNMQLTLKQNGLKDVYGSFTPSSNTLVLGYAAPPAISKLEPSNATDGKPLELPPKQGYIQLTVTFDKNILGLDPSKLQVSGGQVTRIDGGGNLYNLFVTPMVAPGQTANVTVTIPANGIATEISGVMGTTNPTPLVLFNKSYTAPAKSQPGSVTAAVTVDSYGTTKSGGQPQLTLKVVFTDAVPLLTDADFVNAVNPAVELVPGSVQMVNATTYLYTVQPKNPQVVSPTVDLQGIPKAFSVLSSGPTWFWQQANIQKVTATTTSGIPGKAGIGDTVVIQVNFTQAVTVDQSKGSLNLRLATGGWLNNAIASYDSGSGTSTLTFKFQVQPGQVTPPGGFLDYTDNKALLFNDGVLTTGNGVKNNNVTLPLPGNPNSLSQSKIQVVETKLGPDVVKVTGVVKRNGTILPEPATAQAGDKVEIQVQYGTKVVVTGTPLLHLNTIGTLVKATAFYTGGSGTNTLTFTYTVTAGANAGNLDYISQKVAGELGYPGALDLGNGTIKDAATGKNASLVLPAPGTQGSLSANNLIVVRTTTPSLLEITGYQRNFQFNGGTVLGNQYNLLNPDAPQTIGVYKANSQAAPDSGVYLSLGFTDTVVVGSTLPTLQLNTGGVAEYFSGSGTGQLLFLYKPKAGEQVPSGSSTPNLEITGISGIIKDLSGKVVQVNLPKAGAVGSFSTGFPTLVYTTPPKVVNVYTTKNGTQFIGNGVRIAVVFDRPVRAQTGTDPFLQMNPGADAKGLIEKDSKENFGSTKFFNYNVADGDNSDRLNYVDINSLVGTFVDLAGNSATGSVGGNLALPPVTFDPQQTGHSLGANNLLVIRTTSNRSEIASISAGVISGTYGVGQQIPIQVTYSLPVVLDATPSTLPTITLQLDNNKTATATYSGPTNIQLVTVQGAPGSSFVLGYNGQSTSPLTVGVTAQQVEDALNLLSTISGSGHVSVTQSGNAYRVTFEGGLAYKGGTILQGTGTSQTFTVNGTDKFFVLTYPDASKPGSFTSAQLDATATAVDVKTAIINSISSQTDLQITDVTKVGNTYTITFTSATNTAPKFQINMGAQPPFNATGTSVSTGAELNNVLTFLYTVKPGDSAKQLKLAANANPNLQPEISLNGSTLKSVLDPSQAAATKLPFPGTGGTLNFNRSITIVDTSTVPAPAVVNVFSPTPSGLYAPGSVIPVRVEFSSAVVVKGLPEIWVTTASAGSPGRAVYASGSGTNTLTFLYRVPSGQTSAILKPVKIELVSGSSIADAADGSGRSANLVLPTTPLTTSLGIGSVVVVGQNQLGFLSQTAQQSAGRPVIPPVQVQLLGPNGKPMAVANQAVTIKLSSGTVTGTLTVKTDARGIATFNNLTIAAAGTYQWIVTGLGIPETKSNPFKVV